MEHEPDFADKAVMFGEKVRMRAHELNLTQRDLIAHTGLSRSYVQLLWNGRGSHRGREKVSNPTMDVIMRISMVLKVDDGYLIDHSRPIGDFRERPGVLGH